MKAHQITLEQQLEQQKMEHQQQVVVAEEQAAEMEELREKVGTVDHAASASSVAELRKKMLQVDKLKKRMDELSPASSSSVDGGLRMLPASERSGGATEEVQRLQREVAELQGQVYLLTERMAAEEEHHAPP